MNSERDSNYPPPLPPSGAALDLEQLRKQIDGGELVAHYHYGVLIPTERHVLIALIERVEELERLATVKGALSICRDEQDKARAATARAEKAEAERDACRAEWSELLATHRRFIHEIGPEIVAERDAARAALEPFANLADRFSPLLGQYIKVSIATIAFGGEHDITPGDLRRARAALAQKEPK